MQAAASADRADQGCSCGGDDLPPRAGQITGIALPGTRARRVTPAHAGSPGS